MDKQKESQVDRETNREIDANKDKEALCRISEIDKLRQKERGYVVLCQCPK